MPYQTMNPTQAKELLDGEEPWIYLDVRTVEEFTASHVPGAYNIPAFFRDSSGGMTPNPDFAEVVRKSFEPSKPMVLGCAAGMRSKHACEALEGAGFERLVNMWGGFMGARDPSGQVVEAGWQALGFPTGDNANPDRTYDHLKS